MRRECWKSAVHQHQFGLALNLAGPDLAWQNNRASEQQQTRCVSVLLSLTFSDWCRYLSLWGFDQLNSFSFHWLSLHYTIHSLHHAGEAYSPLMITQDKFLTHYLSMESLTSRPFGEQRRKIIIFGCGYVFVAIIAIARRRGGMRGQPLMLWTQFYKFLAYFLICCERGRINYCEEVIYVCGNLNWWILWELFHVYSWCHKEKKNTNFDFMVAKKFIKMVYSGNTWQSDKVAHEAQYNNK